MKDVETQIKTLKDNLVKYVLKVGVGVVSFSLCLAILICVNDEKKDNQLPCKILTISELEDTTYGIGTYELTDTKKVEYADRKDDITDSAMLARIEESEHIAEEYQLNQYKAAQDAIAARELEAERRKSVSVAAAAPIYSETTSNSAGTFVITAYCSCAKCCGKTNGITASGTQATAGRTVAADTSRFPFGTQLVINGQVYTVEDRGSAIHGNRIDIFFNSHAEALAYGRQTAEVYYK